MGKMEGRGGLRSFLRSVFRGNERGGEINIDTLVRCDTALFVPFRVLMA